MFNQSGTFLRKFGGRGRGPVQLTKPTGLAFDRAGTLLVCDSRNNRIQALTTEGRFLTEFSLDSEVYSVHVHSDGRIFVGCNAEEVFVFGFEA